MIRLDRNGQVDFKDSGVLVVDDEQFSRAIIRQSLLNLGCGRVDVVENGAQALEILLGASQSYDAVISDFRMPVMDGLELLRRIRCGARGVPRDIVFGILTGFSDKEVIGLAFNLDVDFFITKPPTIDGLKTRLTKAMTSPRPIKAMKEYTKTSAPVPKPKATGGTPTPDAAPPETESGPPEPKAGIVLKSARRPTAVSQSTAQGASSMPAPSPAAATTSSARGADSQRHGAGTPQPAATAPVGGNVVSRSLSEVLPGAVLGDDLRTSSGTLILQRGFKLTPQLIERLRNLAEVDPDVRSLRVVLADED